MPPNPLGRNHPPNRQPAVLLLAADAPYLDASHPALLDAESQRPLLKLSTNRSSSKSAMRLKNSPATSMRSAISLPTMPSSSTRAVTLLGAGALKNVGRLRTHRLVDGRPATPFAALARLLGRISHKIRVKSQGRVSAKRMKIWQLYVCVSPSGLNALGKGSAPSARDDTLVVISKKPVRQTIESLPRGRPFRCRP